MRLETAAHLAASAVVVLKRRQLVLQYRALGLLRRRSASHSLVNCGESAPVLKRRETCKSTHVTTLEHELGDDTVEARAGVAEALLASAESTEVGGRLGDNVVKELEDDAARGGVCAGQRCTSEPDR